MMIDEVEIEGAVMPEAEEVTAENTEAEEIAEEVASDAPDYAAIIEEDLETLRRTFTEMRGVKSITELDNPLRYAALRDLGLSAREAYLATSERREKRDNRSHLVGATPRAGAYSSSLMSRDEIRAARQLFDGMSDADIQSLYKKVTRN